MINKGGLYNLIYKITPPVIFSLLKDSKIFSRIKKLADKFLKKDNLIPTWNVVSDGIIKGRKLFIDPNGVWAEMVSGDYDNFFIEFLKRFDLKEEIIYDIGAHIGFSSMCFAELVGPSGKVIAFEPNIFNTERFEYILKENKDFDSIIKIHNIAISDKVGEEDFVFSDNIDNGTSSGSFINSSHTFFEKNTYESNIGFKRMKTKTVPIDLLKNIGIDEIPYLIKIDIEGAEYLALQGAREMLATHKPILLMEIHSIFNMLKVGEILHEFNYKVELLKEEKDGRCFISAV